MIEKSALYKIKKKKRCKKSRQIFAKLKREEYNKQRKKIAGI